MRKQPAICLLSADDGWQLMGQGFSKIIAESDASPIEVAESLAAQAPDGASLGILLESHRVFPVCFGARELGKSRSTDAVAFRLESELPYNAEEVLADSLLQSGQVFACATPKDILNALIAEITRSSARTGKALSIKSIAPASLMLTQALVFRNEIPNDAHVLLPTFDGETVELIDLQAGVPHGWRIMRTDASTAEWGLAFDNQKTVPVFAIRDRCGSEYTVALETTGKELDLSAARYEMLASVIADRAKPWIDFTRAPEIEGREQGISNQIWNRLTLVSVCLIIAACSILFRSYRLAESTGELRDQQTEVFRSTFPNQRVPAAVLKRLRSELQRVRGSRTSGLQNPQPVEAIPVLAAILNRLPTDIGASFTEIRIQDGDILLDARLESHADATRIVEALQSRELTFSPPSTEVAGSEIVGLMRGQVVENNR